jgi:hypothetical protein
MVARPSVGLCFTSAEVLNGGFRRIGEDSALSFPDYTEALLTAGNIVPGGGSSAMVRRSVLDAVGYFDPKLSQCADWDLWLRVSVASDVAGIDEMQVRYRPTPGSMSSDPVLLERDTFALLDKFFASPESTPYLSRRRRVYATQWMVCAGTYLHAGRLRDSLRCVRRGVVTDPSSLARPLLLPVRVGSRVWRSRWQRR